MLSSIFFSLPEITLTEYQRLLNYAPLLNPNSDLRMPIKPMSTINKNIVNKIEKIATTIVEESISFLGNQETFFISDPTLEKYLFILFIIIISMLQVRKDSNPQLPALEAGALPIELLSFI